MAEALAPLIAEAARKSRVCWLSYAAGGHTVRDRLVWHTWHDGALVVLADPEEQPLPGLAEAERALVTMRSKETRARLVSWSGTVEVVEPESESWGVHAQALLGVRLNLPDPAESRDEWRRTAQVIRIVASEEPGGAGPGH